MSTGRAAGLALLTLVVGGFVGLALGLAVAQEEAGAGDAAVAAAMDDVDPEVELARLDELVEANPDSASAYVDRAEFHSEQWDTDAAIADYDRAIELEPGNDELHVRRADMHSSNGDTDLALADLDRAIELAPDNSDHFYRRGNELRWDGLLEEAVADYSASIDRYRLNPESYRQRAWAYAALEDHNAAFSDWTDLIELEPVWYNYEARAWASIQAGNIDAAIEDYSVAMTMPDSSTIRLLTLRGDAHLMSGDDDAALADYTEAVEVEPDFGPYRERGQLHFDQGRRELALADYDLAVDGGDVIAAYARGLLHLEDGRWSEAEADFTTVVDEMDSGYWYDYSYDYFAPSEPVLTTRAVVHQRSRARAAAGDLSGAASDLNRYLDELERYNEPEVGAATIREWFSQLEGGTNPFG